MFLVVTLLWSIVTAVKLKATATEYTWPGGGNSCGAKSGTCGAVSDGWHELWDNVWGISKHCDNAGRSGSCDSCGSITPPGCPYKQLCDRKLCVRCVDTRQGVCKTNKWFTIEMADACPMHHPCNTCKGNQNPCGSGRAHVDLCTPVFNQMFHRQPTWEGSNIEVETNIHNCDNNSPLPGPTPSGGGGQCTDVAPDNTYSCQQQRDWGKCGEAWMQGKCDKTCGRCGGCSDVPPDGTYSCQQQKDWGKCGEAWMQGKCDRTCGRCGGARVADQSSSSDNTVPIAVGVSVGVFALIVIAAIAAYFIVGRSPAPETI